MTVKEMIEELSKHPQDADVCYTGEDNGLISVSAVKEAYPADEEAKEILGERFVFLE